MDLISASLDAADARAAANTTSRIRGDLMALVDDVVNGYPASVERMTKLAGILHVNVAASVEARRANPTALLWQLVSE